MNDRKIKTEKRCLPRCRSHWHRHWFTL